MKQYLAVEEIYTPIKPGRADYRPGIKTHEPGWVSDIHQYRLVFSAESWKEAESKVESYMSYGWEITLCGELTNG